MSMLILSPIFVAPLPPPPGLPSTLPGHEIKPNARTSIYNYKTKQRRHGKQNKIELTL